MSNDDNNSNSRAAMHTLEQLQRSRLFHHLDDVIRCTRCMLRQTHHFVPTVPMILDTYFQLYEHGYDCLPRCVGLLIDA